MSDDLLVTVADSVPNGRGDAVLHPRVVVQAPPTGPFAVELVLPDGTRRTGQARFDVAHLRNAHGTFALVRLLDCGDVPPGTKVYRRA